MRTKRKSEVLSQNDDITENEAALYDRQIRLWGLESQKRLKNAEVLLVGIGGLGAEVAKNIVLAGVKSITLLDDKEISLNDRSAQFLVAEAELGRSRAEGALDKLRKLNPNVLVTCDRESIDQKPDSYLTQFNVISATDCSPSVLLRLNKICREHKICFFCGDTWGLHGYCFVDLVLHTYLPFTPNSTENKDSGEPAAKKACTKDFKTVKYGSLKRALSIKSGKTGTGLHKKTSKIFFLLHILLEFHEKHKRFPEPQHRNDDIESLKSLRSSVLTQLGFDENKISLEDLSAVFGELSPVCAVVGGVLSQEIIKAICADQQPIENFFLFDGDTSLGVVECIG